MGWFFCACELRSRSCRFALSLFNLAKSFVAFTIQLQRRATKKKNNFSVLNGKREEDDENTKIEYWVGDALNAEV